MVRLLTIIAPMLLLGTFKDHMINVDYGAQRCLSSNCTCEVKFTRKPSPPEEIVREISTSVFFSEDSSDVSDSYVKEVKRFLIKNPDVKNFTVVGYTDGCGTREYNNRLSTLRARQVRKIVLRARPSATIKILGMSELSTYHSDSAKKVDIIAGKKVILKQSFPNLKADFYLIDLSGSMRGKIDMWKEAIAHSKPSGARVFISYTDYCHRNQDLESISPSGGTEIWYSYWWVLDKMSTGQTLMIISDFDSRIPLTSRERAIIESKVSAKEIKVYAFTP